MSDKLNAGATFETTRTMKDDTQNSFTHSNKTNMRRMIDGQMIFGDLGAVKLPEICLAGEEKPRKNLTQETCPDRGSNPGPLCYRRACCRLAHSGGLSFYGFRNMIIKK